MSSAPAHYSSLSLFFALCSLSASSRTQRDAGKTYGFFPVQHHLVFLSEQTETMGHTRWSGGRVWGEGMEWEKIFCLGWGCVHQIIEKQSITSGCTSSREQKGPKKREMMKKTITGWQAKEKRALNDAWCSQTRKHKSSSSRQADPVIPSCNH